MNGLKACREGLEEVRRVLAADKLLAHEPMERVVALMSECEREAAAYSSIVLEVRAAQMKVRRCEVKGEFLDFLEAQYRARGLSTPRKIATLVVLEDAMNALKRAMAATTEQMRRTTAA